MSHQNTKQVHKNWVFCHLGKLKTMSNVGIYIHSLQLNFTFIKSPVWQGKSPVTGHERDSKKCLVCKPDLMFVTHLIISKSILQNVHANANVTISNLSHL